MKYIFIVEWDKDFVKSCKKGACSDLPISFVLSNYKGKMILATHNDAYCQWIAPSFTEEEAKQVYETLTAYLVKEFKLGANANVLTVRYNVYGSSMTEGGAASDASGKPAAEPARPKHELTRRIEALTDGLIAAVDFKELIADIAKMAPLTSSGSLGEIFEHCHYIFSVDEGYDVKSYVSILTDALHMAGLFARDRIRYTYRRLPKEEDKRVGDPVQALISDIADMSSTVIILNIIEWMDAVRTEDFRKLLQAIERQHDCVFVFTIPYVDKVTLNRVFDGINDVLNVRAISFVPFTKDELQQCAERFFRGYSAEMTEEAWRIFHTMILKEKADGNFYGENTVKKVCRDILLAKALFNADTGESGMVIDAADIASVAPQDAQERTAQDMLDSMVGMDGVRKKLYEIVEQIDATRQLGDADMPSVHMRFVGNPGTGKTTVARIMGLMLKERGLLRIGDLYEIHGRDLVGRYVGETSPKTASICRDAYGSVLFIDEAYSLYRSEEDSRDFGREALDTLIAQMENHRTDFVVIMAGYTDDIATMMKGNMGLENRMPYLVEFPNYTQEELYEIFCLMVRRYGRYEDDMLVAAKDFFMALPNSYISDKAFGNGRYVRNIFERTRAKAITRRQLEHAEELVLKKEDFVAASNDSEFKPKQSDTSRKIGFN